MVASWIECSYGLASLGPGSCLVSQACSSSLSDSMSPLSFNILFPLDSKSSFCCLQARTLIKTIGIARWQEEFWIPVRLLAHLVGNCLMFPFPHLQNGTQSVIVSTGSQSRGSIYSKGSVSQFSHSSAPCHQQKTFCKMSV